MYKENKTIVKDGDIWGADQERMTTKDADVNQDEPKNTKLSPLLLNMQLTSWWNLWPQSKETFLVALVISSWQITQGSSSYKISLDIWPTGVAPREDERSRFVDLVKVPVGLGTSDMDAGCWGLLGNAAAAFWEA